MKHKEYYLKGLGGGILYVFFSLICLFSSLAIYRYWYSGNSPLWIIPSLILGTYSLLFLIAGIITIIALSFQLTHLKKYHKCKKCEYRFKKSEGPLCITCKDKK